MTIEIRQLVIRAVVQAPASQVRPAPTRAAPPAPSQDEIVAACVREVLRRLGRARER
jgi:hypothetical protein